MKTIEVRGRFGQDEILYELERPLLVMELWQIRVNGETIGSVYHAKDREWYARSGVGTWLTGFEVLTFIELITADAEVPKNK